MILGTCGSAPRAKINGDIFPDCIDVVNYLMYAGLNVKGLRRPESWWYVM